ncbi:UPF0758 domain-containing protein, partial [Methylobacterium sp. WL6]|uniref:UPF0758 domain-containing protein n=1 Tax=Methylobacterium sp. WL6 TaxID=2603901 RepID=UPI001FEEB734
PGMRPALMGRIAPTGDDAGMPIHDWHEQERPREKLIARGPATLSDAELLALFLGSGFGGRDAVQTARDLLQAHGPLRVLLDRPAREAAAEVRGLLLTEAPQVAAIAAP